MGGGFRFSAISQGVKGRAEIERWEQEALQRDH
jgi:hypothetical protein